MKKPNERAGAAFGWILLIGAMFVLPITTVMVAYWLFHVDLFLLLSISFVLLLLGSIACWPETLRHASNNKKALTILITGQSAAVAIVILFLIQVLTNG